ncbi:DNA/RNA polymerase, partial [Rhizophagus irregularis]
VDLLQQYRHLFAWDATQLGRTDLVQHTIDVGNATPIKKRWYRTSRMERDFIAGEIDRMLQQNLIEKSRGPWAFPVVLVRKKNGKLRF